MRVVLHAAAWGCALVGYVVVGEPREDDHGVGGVGAGNDFQAALAAQAGDAVDLFAVCSLVRPVAFCGLMSGLWRDGDWSLFLRRLGMAGSCGAADVVIAPEGPEGVCWVSRRC